MFRTQHRDGGLRADKRRAAPLATQPARKTALNLPPTHGREGTPIDLVVIEREFRIERRLGSRGKRWRTLEQQIAELQEEVHGSNVALDYRKPGIGVFTMGFKRHREVPCISGNWPLQVTQQKLVIPISVCCRLKVSDGRLIGDSRCVSAKGRGCDRV
eukprot:jgi/Botrbrau1/14265/Bobra.113_2s0011.1